MSSCFSWARSVCASRGVGFLLRGMVYAERFTWRRCTGNGTCGCWLSDGLWRRAVALRKSHEARQCLISPRAISRRPVSNSATPCRSSRRATWHASPPDKRPRNCKRPRDAYGLYQSVVDSSPDNVEARVDLARLLVYSGGGQQALKIIEPGLAKHPDNAALLTFRAAARVETQGSRRRSCRRGSRTETGSG